MAGVFGIHEVMLRPGLSEAEFERFVAEELSRLSHAPGTRVHVLMTISAPLLRYFTLSVKSKALYG